MGYFLRRTVFIRSTNGSYIGEGMVPFHPVDLLNLRGFFVIGVRISGVWAWCDLGGWVRSDRRTLVVCYCLDMPDQLNLPITSWEELGSVRSAGGRRLRRWGSVKEAGRMLWGYSKATVYVLIEAGEIKAVKRGARNCHWRVDLVSVWEYKTRVETGKTSPF